jgi:AGCS family alanine or glycine:cation symporter
MEEVLSKISDIVWGYPLLILLMGTHIYLTIRLKFIQKYIPLAIKLSFKRQREGKGDISHYGALTTALAATIGTGNIVGVATAVSSGGPGAVLWMWLTGVFGISTKFSEALLSIKFRTKNKKGETIGGPMFVLEKGLHSKLLAILFAFFTAFAAFGIGCMVQANAITSMLKETILHYGFSTGKVDSFVIVCGLTLSILTGTVIIGGIKWIANFCEKIVPLMAVVYLLGCTVLLIHHFERIPETLGIIFSSSLGIKAVAGGFLGATMKDAIRFGVARGLFSNESGLGSAPIVAACAQTKNGVRQSLVSMTGTFWDTVVVCAMTGIVLVNSGKWKEGISGALLTKEAFTDLNFFGPIILTISLLFFVFSTILGWEYYGEKATEYLFGEKSQIYYRILWVIFVFLGSVLALKTVWTMADIANGLMAIPNLIALLFLSHIVLKECEKYLFSNRLDEIDPDLE